MDDLLPFVLLAVALLVFLLSTRQMRFVWRCTTWIVGAALLAASAILVLGGPASPGILQALTDLFFRQHGGDVLVTAIEGNSATVGAVIAPMFGIFFLLAAIEGVTSLVAFTPGEGVEKVIRPINIALLGAIAGGLLTLAIAGIGFGGLEKRQVYLNFVAADNAEKDVVDGDGIRMGDVSLRLWGIDAPESNTSQICRRRDDARTRYPCGEDAKVALTELVKGQLVICEAPKSPKEDANKDSPPPRESFGRPIMSCWIGGAGDRLYLSAEMARQGYAGAYPEKSNHASKDQILAAVAEAQSKRVGMWSGWTISPDDWRNDELCRSWFMSDNWQPPDDSGPLVTCDHPALSPANGNPPLAAASSSTPPATPP